MLDIDCHDTISWFLILYYSMQSYLLSFNVILFHHMPSHPISSHVISFTWSHRFSSHLPLLISSHHMLLLIYLNSDWFWVTQASHRTRDHHCQSAQWRQSSEGAVHWAGLTLPPALRPPRWVVGILTTLHFNVHYAYNTSIATAATATLIFATESAAVPVHHYVLYSR